MFYFSDPLCHDLSSGIFLAFCQSQPFTTCVRNAQRMRRPSPTETTEASRRPSQSPRLQFAPLKRSLRPAAFCLTGLKRLALNGRRSRAPLTVALMVSADAVRSSSLHQPRRERSSRRCRDRGACGDAARAPIFRCSPPRLRYA